MQHLFTKSRPAPPEYVELVMCRDIYHCRPSELAQEDWAKLNLHLALLKTEADVMEQKRKARNASGRGARRPVKH